MLHAKLQDRLQEIWNRELPNLPRNLIDVYLQAEDGGNGGDGPELYDGLLDTVRLSGIILSDEMLAFEEMWFGTSEGLVSPSKLRAAVQAASDRYVLEINSMGGDVFAGAEMFATLALQPPSMVRVTGIAASMGAMLALCTRERYAATELSMMMFHAPWAQFQGNVADMRGFIEQLQTVEDALLSVCRKNLLDEAVAEIENAFADGKDLTLTAQRCVDLGILGYEDVQNNGDGDGDGMDDSGTMDSNRRAVMQMHAIALQGELGLEIH